LRKQIIKFIWVHIKNSQQHLVNTRILMVQIGSVTISKRYVQISWIILVGQAIINFSFKLPRQAYDAEHCSFYFVLVFIKSTCSIKCFFKNKEYVQTNNNILPYNWAVNCPIDIQSYSKIWSCWAKIIEN
jgi:hypothetical protein